MDAKPTLWDPLRRKEVARTPEEEVRQWFIGVLRDAAGVPEHLMGSEVGLRYGAAGKRYRADIVVYGRDARPAAVVECKRPEVALDAEVLRQALRYDMVLSIGYMLITNGSQTRCYRREGDAVVAVDHLPTYEEICRR